MHLIPSHLILDLRFEYGWGISLVHTKIPHIEVPTFNKFEYQP